MKNLIVAKRVFSTFDILPDRKTCFAKQKHIEFNHFKEDLSIFNFNHS